MKYTGSKSNQGLVASLMAHEEKARPCSCAINGESHCSPTCWNTDYNSSSSGSKPLESSYFFCRVCHCAESDLRGDAALRLLDIFPPSEAIFNVNMLGELPEKFPKRVAEKDVNDCEKNPGSLEFISPGGEVFVCSDLVSSSYDYQNTLVNIGCSCKNDLALAHYDCALKWFISHGSTICEICGTLAQNIRSKDFLKIVSSLKEYESLRDKTARGELAQIHLGTNSVPQEAIVNQTSNTPTENNVAVENPTASWAVEGTGILIATGLLTVTLAWLIAPHVGKKTARKGFHILLGGIIALSVVIFLRFVVLSRIKYGPARYWPILIVFWFLVFGIWASRTHGARHA